MRDKNPKKLKACKFYYLIDFGIVPLREPALGFEPRTDGLQNRCSTTELCRQALELFPYLGLSGKRVFDKAQAAGKKQTNLSLAGIGHGRQVEFFALAGK